MNETVKEITGILDTGRPDLQVAAAQILGELRIKDPSVVRALAAAAPRSHVLGRYSLEALARVGTTDALRVVVRILCEHDSLADQAIHLLGEAGAAAHPLVAEAFADAQPDRRLRLLQVLVKQPSKDGIRPFVTSLLTPETCQAAARLIIGSVASMQPPLPKLLREAVEAALEQPLPDVCVVAALGVAVKVDPAGVRPLLARFSGDRVAPAVRSAALRGMAGSKFSATQVKAFLQQLEDPHQREVHDAIRELLSALPEWPEGLAPILKRLLAARHPEQRLFAMRVLRTSPSPDLVRLALKLRDHEDPRFRTAAEDVLGANRQAIEPLLRLLQMTRDPAEGRRLATLLVRHAPTMQLRQARSIAERAVKLMTSNAVAGDLLCDVAVAIGGQKLVPFMLDKALRWRRSRRYPEALHLLAKLASAQLLDGEGRYQLALVRYLQESLRASGDGATPGNAAMGFFAALLRDGFPLLDRLKKESSLQPDQLLRLATYFADTVGPERRFGSELLQHLAARHKGRTGEEARYALRTAGL